MSVFQTKELELDGVFKDVPTILGDHAEDYWQCVAVIAFFKFIHEVNLELEKILGDKEPLTEPKFVPQFMLSIPEQASWRRIRNGGISKHQALTEACHLLDHANPDVFQKVLIVVADAISHSLQEIDPKASETTLTRLLEHFENAALFDVKNGDVLTLAHSISSCLYALRGIQEPQVPSSLANLMAVTMGMGSSILVVGDIVDIRKLVAPFAGLKNIESLSIGVRTKDDPISSLLTILVQLFLPSQVISLPDSLEPDFFYKVSPDRVISFEFKSYPDKTAKRPPGRMHTKRQKEQEQATVCQRLQHLLDMASPRGTATALVSSQVLTSAGRFREFRKSLLEADLIETVISLPARILKDSALLILKKSKEEAQKGKVLFIDASIDGLYLKSESGSSFRQEDILRITAVHSGFGDFESTRECCTKNPSSDREALLSWLETPRAFERFCKVMTNDDLCGLYGYELNAKRLIKEVRQECDPREEMAQLAQLAVEQQQLQEDLFGLMRRLMDDG